MNPVQIPKRFECPDPKISQSNEVPDQVVQQVRPLTFLWLHNEDPSHRGYPEPPLGYREIKVSPVGVAS
jgi:hypothetical protein